MNHIETPPKFFILLAGIVEIGHLYQQSRIELWSLGLRIQQPRYTLPVSSRTFVQPPGDLPSCRLPRKPYAAFHYVLSCRPFTRLALFQLRIFSRYAWINPAYPGCHCWRLVAEILHSPWWLSYVVVCSKHWLWFCLPAYGHLRQNLPTPLSCAPRFVCCFRSVHQNVSWCAELDFEI